jgi:hypothetical protein
MRLAPFSVAGDAYRLYEGVSAAILWRCLALHNLSLHLAWSSGGKVTAAVLQIFIRVDEQCKVLCKIDALSTNQAKAFKGKIEDEYRVLM